MIRSFLYRHHQSVSLSVTRKVDIVTSMCLFNNYDNMDTRRPRVVDTRGNVSRQGASQARAAQHHHRPNERFSENRRAEANHQIGRNMGEYSAVVDAYEMTGRDQRYLGRWFVRPEELSQGMIIPLATTRHEPSDYQAATTSRSRRNQSQELFDHDLAVSLQLRSHSTSSEDDARADEARATQLQRDLQVRLDYSAQPIRRSYERVRPTSTDRPNETLALLNEVLCHQELCQDSDLAYLQQAQQKSKSQPRSADRPPGLPSSHQRKWDNLPGVRSPAFLENPSKYIDALLPAAPTNPQHVQRLSNSEIDMIHGYNEFLVAAGKETYRGKWYGWI